MQKELHVCGIIIENNKILLLQRSLNDKSEPGKWCPINETVEKDEQLENAVIRGTKEEVGVKFIIKNQIKPKLFDDVSTTVFCGTRVGKIKMDKNESNQYKWFSYDEAIKLTFAYKYEKLIEDLHTQGLLKSNKDLLLKYLKIRD
ncbi:MAG: dihydroneopterin triphosphate pyrophosphatase [Firmicutes bacterium ADurb.Bin373]|nr:MAG: dihydroneopterin triphosphate pyrophosphatase [Firmicutes bacterium ADurb.Bin373]